MNRPLLLVLFVLALCVAVSAIGGGFTWDSASLSQFGW